MDPRGVVQDVHSTGITYDHSTGMLSPDKCAELVSALHTDAPKGKGNHSIHKHSHNIGTILILANCVFLIK